MRVREIVSIWKGTDFEVLSLDCVLYLVLHTDMLNVFV